MTKPLEERKYLALLKLLGWKIKKSGFDYTLYDENEMPLCTIKITHGKGKKREVCASSIRKTQIYTEKVGKEWPPKKK